MKNYIFLSIAILLFLFSCTEKIDNRIIGDWEITDIRPQASEEFFQQAFDYSVKSFDSAMIAFKEMIDTISNDTTKQAAMLQYQSIKSQGEDASVETFKSNYNNQLKASMLGLIFTFDMQSNLQISNPSNVQFPKQNGTFECIDNNKKIITNISGDSSQADTMYIEFKDDNKKMIFEKQDILPFGEMKLIVEFNKKITQ